MTKKEWFGLGVELRRALSATRRVVAVIAHDASAAPSPPPPVSQNPLLAPITDKNTVTYYQNGFAQGLLQYPTTSPQDMPGLTAQSYGPTDVDGNPQNARWVAALATFQKDANAEAAAGTPPGYQDTPAGFPAQLRTDGVLDYATAIILANA
jgi:hypothetical protein